MALTPVKARQIIADAVEKSLDHVIGRDVNVPLDIPKIVTLLGPRRAGKTSVCFQLIKALRVSMSTDRLLYVNFEDDRFFPAELADLDVLLETYYAMYPGNKDTTVYFFFDEIQEIPNWEKFIRRLNDQENCRIYLTGSSSKLLSKEIATGLRGRTLSFEIFPLSFSEFLRFRKVEVNADSSKGKAILQNQLLTYMRQGGFPELIFLPEVFHRGTINEYINLMIYKDLMERFGLRNPHLLKYLLKYYLVNLSNPMSINKVFNDLKSQGYALSKNTVYEYTSYLEEAFVVYRVSMWSTSVRKQSVNPDKLYAVDQAFKYAMSDADDHGRILENMVFIAIRRLGYSTNYLLNAQEVDFYVNETYLVNVCLDTTEETTLQREMSGLNTAMQQTGQKRALLVTLNEEGEHKLEHGKVRIVTARDFLLMPQNFLG